jgi:hypothetical protein
MGSARVHLYSFFEDGRPAMAGGLPYVFDTEYPFLAGYDITIDPATGIIYFAAFPAELGAMVTHTGYDLFSIGCDLVEG